MNLFRLSNSVPNEKTKLREHALGHLVSKFLHNNRTPTNIYLQLFMQLTHNIIGNIFPEFKTTAHFFCKIKLFSIKKLKKILKMQYHECYKPSRSKFKKSQKWIK